LKYGKTKSPCSPSSFAKSCRSFPCSSKLLGDLIFFTLPIVAPWENRYLTEDVGRERKAKYGTPAGAVCFYSPRQQFCVVYGDDASDEPLPISYIGEVIEGQLELKVAGLETWFDQSRIVELKIADA
jgi:hypothetical protein